MPQSSLLLMALLLASAWPIHAQPAPHAADAEVWTDRAPIAAPPPASTPATAQRPQHGRRIHIGSATDQLLTLQRASSGSAPRPIDGEQAQRSYQRYLHSFETKIPEHYGTGLQTGLGAK